MGAACDTVTNEKVLLIVEICNDCLNDYWHDCTCVQPLALCEVVYGRAASKHMLNDIKNLLQVISLDHTYSKQKQNAQGPILRQLLTSTKKKTTFDLDENLIYF